MGAQPQIWGASKSDLKTPLVEIPWDGTLGTGGSFLRLPVPVLSKITAAARSSTSGTLALAGICIRYLACARVREAVARRVAWDVRRSLCHRTRGNIHLALRASRLALCVQPHNASSMAPPLVVFAVRFAMLLLGF